MIAIDEMATARNLASQAIGIDSHIDTVQRVIVMGEDLGKRWNVGHVDIPRLREGGMHAPFFAMWVVATIVDVADHIDHAVKIAGIDQVGIGSEFDGIAAAANGLEDVSKMPALVAVLLSRGYSEGDLHKILGGNHLRVVRAVTGG